MSTWSTISWLSRNHCFELSKPGEKKYIDIFYDIDAHGRYRGGYITYHRAGGDSVGAKYDSLCT